jgi:hypothetical protein
MAEGYWPRIVDRGSAMAAVQMAGLPVFLIGGGTVFLVALAVFGALPLGLSAELLLVFMYTAAVGALLAALGLAVRRRRPSLVPPAAVITFAFVFAVVWLAPWWAISLQIFPVLLILTGLRGWWWLRKNRA